MTGAPSAGPLISQAISSEGVRIRSMRQSWTRSGAGANDLLALTNTSNVDEIQRTFNEY